MLQKPPPWEIPYAVRDDASDATQDVLQEFLVFIREMRGINPPVRKLENGVIRLSYTVPVQSKKEQRRREHGRAI